MNTKNAVMDDKNSFKIRIDAADILIYPTDLGKRARTRIIVFANPNLRWWRHHFDRQRPTPSKRTRSSVTKITNIPFETIGTLRVRRQRAECDWHGEKIKALHVPVKGLMDAFGIEIDDLIKNGKLPGVSTEENDLILDLQQVLPAPHIEGSITTIRIEGNAIATTFSKAPARQLANAPANGNFMAFEGNRMQFGKLTMVDADLVLIDMDPTDPLDFFLEHYRDQLASGYTKISTNFQLRANIKDYEKLSRQATPKSTAPAH